MIKKEGSKYVVKSEKGKNLSKPVSKGKAVKRLKQVEYFKSHDADKKLMGDIKKMKGEC